MTDTATIDGHEVEIQPGETILQAAQRLEVSVPTLCYDERVSASASCRMCMVDVEGSRLPVASCARELQPGMVVKTRSDDIDAFRVTNLRLALSEVPDEECTFCIEQGPCELHALTTELGVSTSSFDGATSGAMLDDSNPFIVRDYSLCISCNRCTRVCNELEQAHAIVPAGRGFDTHIATAFEGNLMDSPCTFCGQCIQTCPTGALMDRKMLGKAKVEEVEKVRTICNFCGTGCGINLHVARGEVIGVTPDWLAPANNGSLCVKGQFGLDFINSPDRLTTPLIRRDGILTPASWEDAYDTIARKFTQVKEESGPDAFTLWSSARATTEANFLMQKLARAAIGTNNIDNCART